jgi:hypothetical protein
MRVKPCWEKRRLRRDNASVYTAMITNIGIFYPKIGLQCSSYHLGPYYPEWSPLESVSSPSLKLKIKVCRFDTTVDNQTGMKAKFDTVTKDEFPRCSHNLHQLQ